MPNLSDSVADAAAQQVEQLFEPQLETLKSLVRIPGIAWDAFDPQQLEASAQAVADLFSSTGLFDSVEILRAEKPVTSGAQASPVLGAPAVVAHRPARAGAPQVLLYAHHDVQPQGDEALWSTSPFEPVLVTDPIHGDRIFGRGAADDKAGIIAHHTALLAVKGILGDDFDLGVTLFVEGEEEAGSPSFRNFLEKHQERLAADVIVVADSSNFSTTVPAITTTLRGLVSQVFEVRTLDHALHSGMYGGVVPDAMLAMVRVLASLHDEVGHVAVAGLHQGQASDLPYSEAELRADSGLLPATELIGSGSILDRIWARPSLTIIGVDVPSVAVSSNTMQPAVRAKVSMRLAPGQDPTSALEALQTHLETNLPFGAAISFGEIEMGSPFAAETGEWAHALMTTALSQAYGTESVDIGIGGSIPFIADLKEIFADAQILVTGVEDPDSRAHSPNESVHLPTLKAAMTAETLFLLGANARATSTLASAGQE